jgi:hypothetical protein
MNFLIDDVARVLATPISRRKAFARIAGILGGALLAGVPAHAQAQLCQSCTANAQCPRGAQCMTCTAGGQICCRPGFVCCGTSNCCSSTDCCDSQTGSCFTSRGCRRLC